MNDSFLTFAQSRNAANKATVRGVTQAYSGRGRDFEIRIHYYTLVSGESLLSKNVSVYCSHDQFSKGCHWTCMQIMEDIAESASQFQDEKRNWLHRNVAIKQ